MTNDNGIRKPAAVWFDLDDTIWDFSGNSSETLIELYHDIGELRQLFPTADQWREKYQTCNHRLWVLYNAGSISRGHLRMERFRQPIAEAGMNDTGARQLSEILDREYLGRLGHKSRLVDGALETLSYMKDKGYRLGILSNGFKEVQYAKLSSSGIASMFDIIVLSDEIDINKPDKRIFDHALCKAGALASESVIIGDNADTDILGGINAGWKAIWFNPEDKEPPENISGKADIIHDLREIIALF